MIMKIAGFALESGDVDQLFQAFSSDTGKTPPPELGANDLRFIARSTSDNNLASHADFIILLLDANLSVLENVSATLMSGLQSKPVAVVCDWWPAIGGDNLALLFHPKPVDFDVFAIPETPIRMRRRWHRRRKLWRRIRRGRQRSCESA